MILWIADHLGLSPTNPTISNLDSWQMGLIYETAMNYPIEGLRRSYFKRKKERAFNDDDLIEAGYSPEEIKAMKGEEAE